jgi:hypothetical protein
LGKVRVPGCQRKIILPGHRRDPEIIVRDGLAKPREFGFEIAVMFGGALVRQQQRNGPEERADLSESFLWPNSPPCAKPEFAEHHPGHMDAGNLSEARGQRLVAAEVSNHDAGVQQDATSRVH